MHSLLDKFDILVCAEFCRFLFAYMSVNVSWTTTKLLSYCSRNLGHTSPVGGGEFVFLCLSTQKVYNEVLVSVHVVCEQEVGEDRTRETSGSMFELVWRPNLRKHMPLWKGILAPLMYLRTGYNDRKGEGHSTLLVEGYYTWKVETDSPLVILRLCSLVQCDLLLLNKPHQRV